MTSGLGLRAAVPATPSPLDPDEEARLVHSLRRELRGDDGHVTATAVRVARTADHLNAACPPPGLAAACGEAE
ncbi:hypothetical protein OG601_37360 [Streptomyces sp. NBC_01239]|uniref:hypothetical protein n=1 Tax=Streptomyces sp. NBC_01239 TaxID=2903792 RepID=UPI002256BE20|nr:hypothetical protein [Streptomyces sp. NBC_01239]MCX4816275.1 hypothetical protein [Streptomyces sp. NBC_01239]